MGSFFNDKNYTEGSSNIYLNYQPALKNLFTIIIFDYSESSDNKIVGDSGCCRFYASSITFNGESLKLERNSVTKDFSYSDNGSPYTWTDKLDITWYEDSDWSVKKYHEKWMSKFYDKEKDCYKSYDDSEEASNNLSRTFKIIFPYTKEQEGLWFHKVYPSNSGNFDLAWGSSSQVTHTLSYYPTSWEWIKK